MLQNGVKTVKLAGIPHCLGRSRGSFCPGARLEMNRPGESLRDFHAFGVNFTRHRRPLGYHRAAPAGLGLASLRSRDGRNADIVWMRQYRGVHPSGTTTDRERRLWPGYFMSYRPPMERGPVAQTSKPAVSPTSKSAACRVARRSGGFGNPRYSRLGSLRYGQRVKYPG
jgi:hypothetical protein